MQSQRMEALGTLAGGIAHDFNNILSAICGYSDLAQRRCSEDIKMREYIDQIRVASDRAKNLVQQILAFSRQSESEKKPVDISRIINETLILIGATFPPSIEIKKHIQPYSGTVFADETQLHQVIMNLCTNAYHAMNKDCGVLDVELAPVTISSHDAANYPDMNPGKYLKLIVADSGHGIDSVTMAKIFDPYFTTKKAGEGTGMGLSTVHGIIKDHGGRIKVYSEPGVGTSFQVFFPLTESAADQSTVETPILPSGSESILFVDDDRVLIEIGKEMLESMGYRVETRASPIDALEAFRMNPMKYDLFISDLTMPKMTGEKLAREIKRIRPDIPIILCSGFSARVSSDTLESIGVSRMIMKPVTLDDLANNVRGALDEQSA